jgi:hypothetical protein
MTISRIICVLLLLLLTGLPESATAKSRTGITTKEGQFLRGCVSLDSIKLCRRQSDIDGWDAVTLHVNGRATRFFDDYSVDDHSYYRMRRRNGHYDVGVKLFSVVTVPMANSRSVEFTISARGIELRRIFGIHEDRCDTGVEPPAVAGDPEVRGYIRTFFYFSLDLMSKKPVLDVAGYDGVRIGTYPLKHVIRNPETKKSGYFEDIIFRQKIDYRKLCEDYQS